MNIHDLLTEKRLRELEEMVCEISSEELQAKLAGDETFKLVEVSAPEHFEKGHLQGAINIPLQALKETALKNFQKFQQMVIYCQEASSSVGTVAARLLQDSGFSNVLLLKGGKETWQASGLPLEGRDEASHE